MVSVIYHPVKLAETLKSPVERAGRLKVLCREVPSVNSPSLISENKEVFSTTPWKEAHQGSPKSGIPFLCTKTIHIKMYEHFIQCCVPSSLHST